MKSRAAHRARKRGHKLAQKSQKALNESRSKSPRPLSKTKQKKFLFVSLYFALVVFSLWMRTFFDGFPAEFWKLRASANLVIVFSTLGFAWTLWDAFARFS